MTAAEPPEGPGRLRSPPPWSLLLIEEDGERRRELERLLEAEGQYRVTTAAYPAEGLAFLDEHEVHAIVVDLTTPTRGLSASQSERLDATLRMWEAVPGVPIVVLVDAEDEALEERAAGEGMRPARVGDPARIELVERDLRIALERMRLERLLEDSSARLEAELRSDPLTMALNRRGLAEALKQEIERSRRSHGEVVALLLDLDDFKRVNDTYGLTAGDRVLVEVVERMRQALRRTDHLSRVGGDEFVVLLPETRPGEARMLAEKIRLTVGAAPFEAGEEPVRLTASIAVVPIAEPSIETILRRGHPILQLSKLTGKDRVSTSEGSEYSEELVGSYVEVIDALSQPGALKVRAAPVVRTEDGKVVGYELFVRSTIPGFESPTDFFRVAVEVELVTRIDLECFRACCRAKSRVAGGWQLHLNLMPVTLSEVPVAELVALLRRDGETRKTIIDLSENQLVGDPAYLETAIAELRSAGVGIALDDGGWGPGCLETLILLRPEILKLRPRLIQDAAAGQDHGRHLQRMVELGHRIGSTVLCEGVETEDHLEILRQLEVDLAEGPYWQLRELDERPEEAPEAS